VLRVRGEIGHGHLVRAPGAFDGLAIDNLGAGPALERAQDDYGPTRNAGRTAGAGLGLNVLNLLEDRVERGGHELVRGLGLVAFDEIGLVAVAGEELREFGIGHAAEDGGISDFVAIKMKDGEHGAVARGIEELVGVPTGRERAGLRFTIAHDTAKQQIRVIEGSAMRVGNGIAKFSAFVDGTGRLRRDVAGNASGE